MQKMSQYSFYSAAVECNSHGRLLNKSKIPGVSLAQEKTVPSLSFVSVKGLGSAKKYNILIWPVAENKLDY